MRFILLWMIRNRVSVDTVCAAAPTHFSDMLFCMQRNPIKTHKYSGIIPKIDGIWFSAPTTSDLSRNPWWSLKSDKKSVYDMHCKSCGKNFVSKQPVSSIHEGKKPYEYETCGYR